MYAKAFMSSYTHRESNMMSQKSWLVPSMVETFRGRKVLLKSEAKIKDP